MFNKQIESCLDTSFKKVLFCRHNYCSMILWENCGWLLKSLFYSAKNKLRVDNKFFNDSTMKSSTIYYMKNIMSNILPSYLLSLHMCYWIIENLLSIILRQYNEIFAFHWIYFALHHFINDYLHMKILLVQKHVNECRK